MITSASNKSIKNVQALLSKAKERKKQGVFVVEGPKMSFEAPYDWVSASCLHVGGTFFENIYNIIAYHILVIADKHYGFSEHDIFDDCINHK